MHTIARVFAIFCIFGFTSVCWLALGAVMTKRSHEQARDTSESVADLWGVPQAQQAPTISIVRAAHVPTDEVGPPSPSDPKSPTAQWDATTVGVDLTLDQRMKGLKWYALYDVAFDGTWRYVHQDQPATASFKLQLPSSSGVYDGFAFLVNGQPQDVTPMNGAITMDFPVHTGETLTFSVRYKSRGEGMWRYEPSNGAGTLKSFELKMTTNFTDVDFPPGTMSPSAKTAEGGGETLTWKFDQIVTGYGIGMVMPTLIQPGELAASLAFSAPISLFFFFLILSVLAKLRDLDIHPINYLFIGAAFFSFHLLFAYSVDRISPALAFGIASVVSIGMVTAYLRLVVSDRFAFREAAAAQLVYLVGFGLAHFLEGFTGLTLTVLSIATLFVVMLLTGRIKWSQTLAPHRPGSFGPVPGLRPIEPLPTHAPHRADGS